MPLHLEPSESVFKLKHGSYHTSRSLDTQSCPSTPPLLFQGIIQPPPPAGGITRCSSCGAVGSGAFCAACGKSLGGNDEGSTAGGAGAAGLPSYDELVDSTGGLALGGGGGGGVGRRPAPTAPVHAGGWLGLPAHGGAPGRGHSLVSSASHRSRPEEHAECPICFDPLCKEYVCSITAYYRRPCP